MIAFGKKKKWSGILTLVIALVTHCYLRAKLRLLGILENYHSLKALNSELQREAYLHCGQYSTSVFSFSGPIETLLKYKISLLLVTGFQFQNNWNTYCVKQITTVAQKSMLNDNAKCSCPPG